MPARKQETSFNSREKEIIDQAVSILRRHLKPQKIFLFGSRAKGTSGQGADFDLAVDMKRPEEEISRAITRELEAAAGLYHVDVVYLKNVDPDFRTLVLRTGKILA